MTAFVVAIAVLQSSPLANLEKRWQEAWKKPQEARAIEIDAINNSLVKMATGDKLATGEDFWKASSLYSNSELHLTDAEMRHEWNLTALALGEKRAGEKLRETWDELMMAAGRFRRFGVLLIAFDLEPGQRWWVDKAPQVIQDVMKEPLKFKEGNSNPEIAAIVKADQDAREGPMNFSDTETMMKMMREDRKRIARIKEIVKSGELFTAQDFSDAALVCQHGGTFGDYMLAHELALCSFLLGNKRAMWLCGASYDRMLMSGGYKQRFCTQYDGKLRLRAYDAYGINDRMRKAVVGRTLAEAKKPPG